jgi:hypothetical protein
MIPVLMSETEHLVVHLNNDTRQDKPNSLGERLAPLVAHHGR